MQTRDRVPQGMIATLLIAMCSLLVASSGQLINSEGQAGSEKPLPIHDDLGGEFSAPSSLGRDVSL
ncbi:MAG: hypothetical protein JRJ05_10425, partial [Deltaproteobacteria bacterium]|nr:hypothetical protein [Deltaproteobacteria bacterium]